MKEWKRRVIHKSRSTQTEMQANLCMRHKVSFLSYPQLHHHIFPEGEEINATVSPLNSASAINNESDLSRNTINLNNKKSINVTKCPLTLRVKNLNTEHRSSANICFTNLSFVIQMWKAQEQKTLCFDSQWGSDWHINDNRWRQR